MAESIVLIVEDNLIAQFALTQLLAKFDFKSVAVSSGEAALETISSARYDCILMDISLPGIDGFETSSRIRNGVTNNFRTPIVAITGHAGEDHSVKIKNSGINDILYKPFDAENLRRVLLRQVYSAKNINLKLLQPLEQTTDSDLI